MPRVTGRSPWDAGDVSERAAAARHRRSRGRRAGRARHKAGFSLSQLAGRWAIPAGLAAAILAVVTLLLVVSDALTSAAVSPFGQL
jgi:hypothetical protein